MSAAKLTNVKAGSGNRSVQAGLLGQLAAALRGVFVELTSSYRPERHYMRGGRTGGVA